METDDQYQMIRFDVLSGEDSDDFSFHSNQSNRPDIMKKYLVYMELPKILIGDYRKSSCVSGNIIRFHFLLRIARDEANTTLRLLPIKAYKAPVVNFAVIHRPFLDDDSARGPIPKSPGARSPLIHYDDDQDAATGGPSSQTDDNLLDDFRSDRTLPPSLDGRDRQEDPTRRSSQTSLDKNQGQEKPSPQGSLRKTQEQPEKPQRRASQSSAGKSQGFEVESGQRRPSVDDAAAKKPEAVEQAQTRPSQADAASPKTSPKQRTQLEVESPSRHQRDGSPDRFLSDDNTTGQTGGKPQKQRRPKKYFVYCEIPKVLVGDYRNSSVICSEIIHAHFLIKIARDEENGQPRLQPVKRYRRPKVNFAVIHRALLVDDEAVGPIPRSPNVKSPMIRQDDDDDDEDAAEKRAGSILHATLGFCYGRLPRSKYELVTQWSLAPPSDGKRGAPMPELELSKAEA